MNDCSKLQAIKIYKINTVGFKKLHTKNNNIRASCNYIFLSSGHNERVRHGYYYDYFHHRLNYEISYVLFLFLPSFTGNYTHWKVNNIPPTASPHQHNFLTLWIKCYVRGRFTWRGRWRWHGSHGMNETKHSYSWVLLRFLVGTLFTLLLLVSSKKNSRMTSTHHSSSLIQYQEEKIPLKKE